MGELEKRISEVLDLMDDEFALFYTPGYGWRAEIVNPCAHVRLGESEGEFQAESLKSAADAVRKLKIDLQKFLAKKDF